VWLYFCCLEACLAVCNQHITFTDFQNPNEDTEWNDILRSKGILPPKEKEVKEADIINMLETTIEEKQSKSEEICTLVQIHL
jgi:hypothetical protein